MSDFGFTKAIARHPHQQMAALDVHAFGQQMLPILDQINKHPEFKEPANESKGIVLAGLPQARKDSGLHPHHPKMRAFTVKETARLEM
ncbi:MAG: hypothetical protein AB7S81_09445 [Bdellovibrionales bacterium]